MRSKSQSSSDRPSESLKPLHSLQDVARANGERVRYSWSVLKHNFVDCYAKAQLSLIFNAQIGGEGNVDGRGLHGAPSISPMHNTMLVRKRPDWAAVTDEEKCGQQVST